MWLEQKTAWTQGETLPQEDSRAWAQAAEEQQAQAPEQEIHPRRVQAAVGATRLPQDSIEECELGAEGPAAAARAGRTWLILKVGPAWQAPAPRSRRVELRVTVHDPANARVIPDRGSAGTSASNRMPLDMDRDTTQAHRRCKGGASPRVPTVGSMSNRSIYYLFLRGIETIVG